MKKLVPIGLVALLLYHTLAYVLVCLSMRWQAENDLSEKLLVYRSTDSLVEFQIPLNDKPDAKAIACTPSDGFGYNGHYYGIVSLELRGDTLFVAGLEVKSQSFWPANLLSFLTDHLIDGDNSHRKATQFLKGLLKDYSPHSSDIFCFGSLSWQETSRISDRPFGWIQTILLVDSPPPQV